jgi:hypothetical protein
MRAPPAAVTAAVVGVLITACSSGDDAAPGSTLQGFESMQTVAIPPERLSPFCEAINDLNERLDAAAPDADTGQMIIDTYSSVVDDVPAEIRDDFLSVLAALQADPSGSATTTTSASTLPQSTTVTTLEDFEEGYAPDDDAALRLNAYLASACTDTQNNPGPSPTEPAPPPLDSTPT